MVFQNRLEAAHLLAKRLEAYKGTNPLVLAIPRGAVPMAQIIAQALEGDLDVVLVRKLGHPNNPEYAIGAIDEEGNVQGGDELVQHQTHLQDAVRKQAQTLQERRKQYTPLRPRINPAGRTVIVVDDGIATGWTLKAALKAVRHTQPKQMIAAFAVGPSEHVAEIKSLADRVVCLHQPMNFQSVGQFFNDFSQVPDQEVMAILKSNFPIKQERKMR